MAKTRTCKDCITEFGEFPPKRDAKYPGPRCYSHHRDKLKKDSERAHELRTQANYGITHEQYWAIYKAQGGCCYICWVATGKVRRLAVDHDHKYHWPERPHDPDKACPDCIRALLCKRCNQLIGWWGVEALQRAIEVLTDPPAQKVLAELRNTVPA